MLQVIGFQREACGCLVGRYWNTATDRVSVCVEAPAAACAAHRRNDLVCRPGPMPPPAPPRPPLAALTPA